MNLEWLFERRPGPVGDVEMGAPREGRLPGWHRIVRILLAAAITSVAVRLIVDAEHRVVASAIFVVYVLAGYVIHPKPETTNTGLLGFIDHPFRWSDDVNRLLVGLRIVLFPGLITATAIRDIFGGVFTRRRLRG